MSPAQDVVIVGAGHNGLIVASYLARAGIAPLVLERRPIVGGAAVTEEFHPGYKCSTLAHAAGPLRADIVAALQLQRHGLEILRPEIRSFAPLPDGRALILADAVAEAARAIATLSHRDAERYPIFLQSLERVSRVVSAMLAMSPPELDHPRARDLWRLIRLGARFHRLEAEDAYRLLRWTPMPVADFASEWFEADVLQALVAARGIFGSLLGPRSPGSTLPLLLHAAADPHALAPGWFARGGIGSVTQALAAAAIEAGAEIRTDAEVARIEVHNGRVLSVVLFNGDEIAARAVVASCDPQRVVLRLIDPIHFDPEFRFMLRNYRMRGTVAKVNLALEHLPTFTALVRGSGTVDARQALAGRIHIGPDLEYLERAFDAAKYGDWSPRPYLEATIPTLLDPSLAPPGRHVMSIYAQFAPYQLAGRSWPHERDALARTVLGTLAEYAPRIEDLVVAYQVITPFDLEQTYSLTGGHIFHGELALDQLFTMRPVLGWGRYRLPIAGLYLCGSGTHPGTGLTGGSGANAAREILRDLRR